MQCKFFSDWHLNVEKKWWWISPLLCWYLCFSICILHWFLLKSSSVKRGTELCKNSLFELISIWCVLFVPFCFVSIASPLWFLFIHYFFELLNWSHLIICIVALWIELSQSFSSQFFGLRFTNILCPLGRVPSYSLCLLGRVPPFPLSKLISEAKVKHKSDSAKDSPHLFEEELDKQELIIEDLILKNGNLARTIEQNEVTIHNLQLQVTSWTK